MRIHWKGLNTAEKKCELEDTASQDVQSETHRGKNFPSMKSVQRATEQTSAQRVSPRSPKGGKGEQRDTGGSDGSQVSKFNKSCKPAEAGCSMNPEHKLHKMTGRHVLTKSLNTCDEAAKEKRHITLRGKVMRGTVGFSLEISKKWGARSLKC